MLGGLEPFPVSIVWNLWIPMRLEFFVWEAMWGRFFFFFFSNMGKDFDIGLVEKVSVTR